MMGSASRIAGTAVLCLAVLAPIQSPAVPAPVGAVAHASTRYDWEGVTGADPTASCATAVDPTCEHFFLMVAEPMSWVFVGAARADCDEADEGCVPLTVRVYTLDADHSLLAQGEEAVEVRNVAQGAMLDVQVAGPSDAAIGLLPYLGYVRSCPAGQFCLPATGR